jgi:hypothetical protein
MTSSPEAIPQLLTAPQAWAAAELQLKHDGTLESARTAWLQKLLEEEFSPSYDCREAAMLLFESPPQPQIKIVDAAAASPAALVAKDADDFVAERYLAHQVEQFARSFFQLPRVNRRLQWHENSALAAQYAAIQTRLTALRACLELETPAFDGSPRLGEPLYRELTRLLVLRPSERAKARRVLLGKAMGDPAPWGEAARWLRRNPGVEELDPDLLEILSDWKQLGKYRNVRAFFSANKFTVKKTRVFDRKFWIGWLVFVVLLNYVGKAVQQLLKEKKTRPTPVQSIDLGPSYQEMLRQSQQRPRTFDAP